MRGLDSVLDDAIERAIESGFIHDDLKWYSWPQTWNDTSCGFGGPAGQMFCSAQTVVVEFPHERQFYIYHGWKFAYTVGLSDELIELMKKFRLPGKANIPVVHRLEKAGKR